MKNDMQYNEQQHNQFSAVLLAVFSVLCFGMALQILVDQTPRTGARVAGVITSTDEPRIVLQAEDFDATPGLGYWDNTVGNSGNVSKAGDVDVSDFDGVIAVENFTKGEWLNYTFTSSGSGQYLLSVKVLPSSNGKLAAEVNGQTLAIVNFPGSNSTTELKLGQVTLIAGEAIQIRLIGEGGVFTIDELVLQR